MAGGTFDGNNVLDAYAATNLAVERCRAGRGPVMLVANTFRMGGHATHDEREARATFAPELFQEWGKREPIGLFEEYLVSQGTARDELTNTELEVEREVERAAEDALASRELTPEPASALQGVYARDSVR